MAASALPAGGVATLKGVDRRGPLPDHLRLRRSPRPAATRGAGRPEGRALVEGLGGPWVQAAYLHALVRAAGGQVAVEVAEDRISLACWVPA
jgi:histidine phosphotransferase ChpT